MLALASSGAIGSTGNITFSGGTLQFSASNTTDYSSRFSSAANQIYSFDTNGQNITLASDLISSLGSLKKFGTGTLTLTGTNTFIGATTINAGTLQIGSGGLIGQLKGNIADNSALIFNRSGSYTYANIISGTGTLTQAGTGTTTLIKVNTYTGATTINAGALFINGDTHLTSSITVNNGGTISGNGTLGTTTINSGGTLAPALPSNGTTATAHITGNLTLNSGATTTITILGASASQVIATGTIALGSSTLNLSGLGGSYLTGNLFYTLLSATSIAGTFSTPSSGTFAGYSYSLSYTSTAITLNLSASIPTNITVAGSPYQVTNVGGSVNPVFQGGTLQVNQGGTYSQAFTLDTSTTNTIDADGNNGTFSGVFSDATTGGNIVFTGTDCGTTTLTGANTYNGATTISSGALSLGTGGALAGNITDNAS